MKISVIYIFVFNLVPCRTITYKANPERMAQIPSNVWERVSFGKAVNNKSFGRSIAMYYTMADVTTYTSDRVIDFPTFVSATGGNLGLFVVFSFLGMFFSVYGWIQTKISEHNQKNAITYVT